MQRYETKRRQIYNFVWNAGICLDVVSEALSVNRPNVAIEKLQYIAIAADRIRTRLENNEYE